VTPRERILVTLEGRTADRVPVAPFVQDEFLAYHYPEKQSVDRVIDAKALADDLDFDLMAKPRTLERAYFLEHSATGWEVTRTSQSIGGNLHHRLVINTPDGPLVQESVTPDAGVATSGLTASITRHLLESEENIAIFFRHLPPFPAAMEMNVRETVALWKKSLGERGVLAPWGPGGIFNLACDLRGIETLLMDAAEDPEAHREFMGRLTEAVEPQVRCLAGSGAECVGFQGNMANAGVMSATFFDEHVRPYEERTLRAACDAGAFTVYHNCGIARRFYPIYREMPMSLWETVSPPPQGDNDLVEAKAAVGDRLCLLGNLDQIDFLKKATPQEVASRTREIMRCGAPGGRYIFSTSDFLEKGTPIENVRAMIDAAKAYRW